MNTARSSRRSSLFGCDTCRSPSVPPPYPGDRPEGATDPGTPAPPSGRFRRLHVVGFGMRRLLLSEPFDSIPIRERLHAAGQIPKALGSPLGLLGPGHEL